MGIFPNLATQTISATSNTPRIMALKKPALNMPSITSQVLSSITDAKKSTEYIANFIIHYFT
jgi:hypothetical protein